MGRCLPTAPLTKLSKSSLSNAVLGWIANNRGLLYTCPSLSGETHPYMGKQYWLKVKKAIALV